MKASDLTTEQKIDGMAAQAIAACGDKDGARRASRGDFHFEASGWMVQEAARRAYYLGRREGRWLFWWPW